MNKENSPIEQRITHLRFELGILQDDVLGRFESVPEELRRKKIQTVASQIVLLEVDREGVEQAFSAYESFESGNIGRQLKDLKKNS